MAPSQRAHRAVGIISRQIEGAPSNQYIDIEDLANRAWPRTGDEYVSDKRSSACAGCDGSDSSNTVEMPHPSGAIVLAPSQCAGSAAPQVAIATIQPFTGTAKDPKIRTAEDYFASLRGRILKIYLFGELIENPYDHPIIWPSVNAVAETYRLGLERPDLGSAVASLSGVRCSRFLHVAESAADLVSQSLMQRELGRRTGTCFQRCVGMDAINATWSTTFEIDAKYGTQYHKRFQNFVCAMQENNYVVGGAMTDAKGDRSKGPGDQDDLDVHTRIVRRNADGSVILRGCKLHQTGTINSHWMIVMPCSRLDEKEKQFAVICAVPVDAAGITYIYGRQSCDLRATAGQDEIDQGNAKFGGQETAVIFEDVVVPAEYVFMDGETDFSQMLVERFTAYHRRSYVCKAGLGDVMLGAAATVADYNGVAKASHVKDKIVEIAYLNENIAGTALAASYGGKATMSGNFLPDVLMANICKHNVTRLPYEIARLTQDMAGGMMVTLPSGQDFKHPVAGPLLEKYLTGRKGVTVENRRRILRLIENMTMGRNAVGYLTESLHGAGSPMAQRVLIQRLMDLEGKKKLAKNLAGIVE